LTNYILMDVEADNVWVYWVCCALWLARDYCLKGLWIGSSRLRAWLSQRSIGLQSFATLFFHFQHLKSLFTLFSDTLKNAGLFQSKFGSNMDKPKCWVKNWVKK